MELLISLDGLTRPSARAPTLRGVSAMGSPALAPGKQPEPRESDEEGAETMLAYIVHEPMPDGA